MNNQTERVDQSINLEKFVPEALIGQRYQKVDTAWTMWEVIAITRDLGNIRHCRIVDVNDRSISKLISEETLTDRKFYKLVI